VTNFGIDALKKQNNNIPAKRIRAQALHHMLYSFSIIMNLVVVIVYWSVLHEDAIAKHKDVPQVGWIRVIHLHTVHSFPAMSCLLNSYCTRVVLKREISKLILVLAFIYSAVQYTSVAILGNAPLYPMINFKDGAKSWIWLGGMTAIPLVAYFGLVKLDEWIKGAHLNKRSEKKVGKVE